MSKPIYVHIDTAVFGTALLTERQQDQKWVEDTRAEYLRRTDRSLFRFAKGAGLMVGDGPEAIMPLHRTQDGKLGAKPAT